jgi:uncharacterized protein
MDGLLALSASYDHDVPVITFPDGKQIRGDDEGIHAALSSHVGRAVTLAREQNISHFDEGPLHLITTASLAHLERAHGRPIDPRRVRANLLLDTGATNGLVEDAWPGKRLHIGDDLIVQIRAPMSRCIMLNVPQVGLPADEHLLTTISRLNETNLGVVADVIEPGIASIGDSVCFLD